MTSILRPPETLGVDGVGLSTLGDWSQVPRAGYAWASVYLGGTYGVKPYAIEAAWDAGVPVMLNYERSPDAAKGGYSAGEQAAYTAYTQALQLGFNGECPLPFSAADEHFADIAGAGLDYHRALVDVLGPVGWVGGAYGFKEMLELLAHQSWWPDDWPLWHWGGDDGGKNVIHDWTWVKQGPGGAYFDSTIGMKVDKNTLYKPMRFWSGYGADPDPEPPEVDVEFAIYQCSDADAAFLGLANAAGIVPWVEWLSGSRKSQYKADGLPERSTSVAGVANCTLIGAIPQGDSRHTWVAGDFAQTSGAGPKGDPGKDAPIPKSFTPIY